MRIGATSLALLFQRSDGGRMFTHARFVAIVTKTRPNMVMCISATPSILDTISIKGDRS